MSDTKKNVEGVDGDKNNEKLVAESTAAAMIIDDDDECDNDEMAKTKQEVLNPLHVKQINNNISDNGDGPTTSTSSANDPKSDDNDINAGQCSLMISNVESAVCLDTDEPKVKKDVAASSPEPQYEDDLMDEIHCGEFKSTSDLNESMEVEDDAHEYEEVIDSSPTDKKRKLIPLDDQKENIDEEELVEEEVVEEEEVEEEEDEEEVEESDEDEGDDDEEEELELLSHKKSNVQNKSDDVIEIIGDDDDDDYDDEDDEDEDKKDKSKELSNLEISDDDSSGSIEATKDIDEGDYDEEEEDDEEDEGEDDEEAMEPAVKSNNLRNKQRKNSFSLRAQLKIKSIKCLNRRAKKMHLLQLTNLVQTQEPKNCEPSNENKQSAATASDAVTKKTESAAPLIIAAVHCTEEFNKIAEKTKDKITIQTAAAKPQIREQSPEYVPKPVKNDVVIESLTTDDEMCVVEDSPVKAQITNGKNELKKPDDSICLLSDDEKMSPVKEEAADKMDVSDNGERSEVIEPQCVQKLAYKCGTAEAGKENGKTGVVVEAEKCDSKVEKVIQPMPIENIVPEVPNKNREKSTSPQIREVPSAETAASNATQNDDACVIIEDDIADKIPTKNSKKRQRSVSLTEAAESNEDGFAAPPPLKRLCAELEQSFGAHDKMLNEYIEKTPNNSIDEIQVHVDQLVKDIQDLNEFSRIKEMEWNNILHLKKVKEEIVLRLKRKKSVMQIMSSKLGEVSDYSIYDDQNDLQPSLAKKITKELKNSILLNNNNSNNVNNNDLQAAAVTTATTKCQQPLLNEIQSILNNRANMDTIDLAKEKANTLRLHRLLFPRSILPKPTGTNSVGQPQQLQQQQYPSQSWATGGDGKIENKVNKSSSQNVVDGITFEQQLQQHQRLLQQQHEYSLEKLQQHNNLQQYQSNAAINEMLLNGHNNQMQIGRQGAIKDVKSIIDDYRQKHPESVPRRGRRLKGILSNDGVSSSRDRYFSGLGAHNQALENRMTELGFLLTKPDANSRPSSGDSSHSNSGNIAGKSIGNMSISDFFVQYNKMTQNDRISTLNSPNQMNSSAFNEIVGINTSTPLVKPQSLPVTTTTTTTTSSTTLGYPEVTLHPVNLHATDLSAGAGGSSLPTSHANSLLHGILTKQNSRPPVGNFSPFSPTLARLLTAPERKYSMPTTTVPASHSYRPTQPTANLHQNISANTTGGALGGGINLSKSQSEITITPIVAAAVPNQPQHTILQQHLQRHHENKFKSEIFSMLDDEADDSVDRLVIDEGAPNGAINGGDGGGMGEHLGFGGSGNGGLEFHENEVPECQGCKKREAKFVCAGCTKQWYCSRSCQVTSWDEHSEICSG